MQSVAAPHPSASDARLRRTEDRQVRRLPEEATPATYWFHLETNGWQCSPSTPGIVSSGAVACGLLMSRPVRLSLELQVALIIAARRDSGSKGTAGDHQASDAARENRILVLPAERDVANDRATPPERTCNFRPRAAPCAAMSFTTSSRQTPTPESPAPPS